MDTFQAREVVRLWEEALNTRDLPRLLHRSAPDIELLGPKGTVRGHAALAEWARHVGLRLDTQRRFAAGQEVVHAQHGSWYDEQTGEVVGERSVSTHYRVRGGRVTRVARYDTLLGALNGAGLSEADEVE